MKKAALFLIAILLALGGAGCTPQDPEGPGPTGTDDPGFRSAAAVLIDSQRVPKESWVFGLRDPFAAGATLRIQPAFGDPLSYRTKAPTYFFVIDDAPAKKFAHPVRYVLVSNGQAEVIDHEWLPTVNGANWVLDERTVVKGTTLNVLKEAPAARSAPRSSAATLRTTVSTQRIVMTTPLPTALPSPAVPTKAPPMIRTEPPPPPLLETPTPLPGLKPATATASRLTLREFPLLTKTNEGAMGGLDFRDHYSSRWNSLGYSLEDPDSFSILLNIDVNRDGFPGDVGSCHPKPFTDDPSRMTDEPWDMPPVGAAVRACVTNNFGAELYTTGRNVQITLSVSLNKATPDAMQTSIIAAFVQRQIQHINQVDPPGAQLGLTTGAPAFQFDPPAALPPVTGPYLYSFCKPMPALSIGHRCGTPVSSTNPAGGQPPYYFQISEGFPPPGITCDRHGICAGFPLPGLAGTTHRFTMCAVDQKGDSVCRQVSLEVRPPGATGATRGPSTSRVGLMAPSWYPTLVETKKVAIVIDGGDDASDWNDQVMNALKYGRTSAEQLAYEANLYGEYLEKKRGFEVIRLTGRAESVNEALEELIKRTDQGDVAEVVFYYNGHGYKGGMTLFDEAGERSDVSYRQLARAIDRIGKDVKVDVALDACQSGSAHKPFSDLGRPNTNVYPATDDNGEADMFGDYTMTQMMLNPKADRNQDGENSVAEGHAYHAYVNRTLGAAPLAIGASDGMARINPTDTLPPVVVPTPIRTVMRPTPISTLASAITPEGPLTGQWTGGYNEFYVQNGAACYQQHGQFKLELNQKGNEITGKIASVYGGSTYLNPPYTGSESPCPTQGSWGHFGPLNGTVNSSSFQFTGQAGANYVGTFTTDLMRGTFDYEWVEGGVTYRKRGCFQVTRFGGLPDCRNPF